MHTCIKTCLVFLVIFLNTAFGIDEYYHWDSSKESVGFAPMISNEEVSEPMKSDAPQEGSPVTVNRDPLDFSTPFNLLPQLHPSKKIPVPSVPRVRRTRGDKAAIKIVNSVSPIGENARWETEIETSCESQGHCTHSFICTGQKANGAPTGLVVTGNVRLEENPVRIENLQIVSLPEKVNSGYDLESIRTTIENDFNLSD